MAKSNLAKGFIEVPLAKGFEEVPVLEQGFQEVPLAEGFQEVPSQIFVDRVPQGEQGQDGYAQVFELPPQESVSTRLAETPEAKRLRERVQTERYYRDIEPQQASVRDESAERRMKREQAYQFAENFPIKSAIKAVGEPIAQGVRTIGKGIEEQGRIRSGQGGSSLRAGADIALGTLEAGIGSIPAMAGINAISSQARPIISKAVETLGGGEQTSNLLTKVFDYALAAKAFGLPIVRGMAVGEISGLLAEAGVNSDEDWSKLEDADKQRIIGIAHNLGFFGGLAAVPKNQFEGAVKPEPPKGDILPFVEPAPKEPIKPLPQLTASADFTVTPEGQVIPRFERETGIRRATPEEKNFPLTGERLSPELRPEQMQDVTGYERQKPVDIVQLAEGFKEVPIERQEILPPSFKKEMTDKLVQSGEKVEGLSDADLIAKYEEKGLAKGDPEEAPVSQGGDISVRGKANEEQIKRFKQGRPKKYSQITEEDYPVLATTSTIKPDWILKDGKVVMREEFQFRREIGSGIGTPEQIGKARSELAKVNERIGALKEDVGTGEDMFNKKEDLFEQPKPLQPLEQPSGQKVSTEKQPYEMRQVEVTSKEAEKVFPLESKVEIRDGKPIYTYGTKVKFGDGERKFEIESRGQPNATVMVERLHKKIVEQALSEGKTVPEEVLTDYPNLQQKYGKKEAGNLRELGTTALAYGGANVAIDQSNLSDEEKNKLRTLLNSVTVFGLGAAIAKSKNLKSLIREKSLLAIHNLSSAKVKFTDKLGGIALPSVAITKKDIPFTSYGEISLLGEPRLVDPKIKGNLVVDADMYSPRYPEVRRNVKGDIIYGIAKEAKKAWLKHFKKEDVPEWKRNSVFYEQGRHDSLGESYRDDFAQEGLRNLNQDDLLTVLFLDKTGKEVPKKKDSLYEARNKYRDEFESFLDEQFSPAEEGMKFFTGFSYSGKKRYKDFSLDNAVAYLKSQMREGEGFSYGAGNVRAAAAKKFRSLEDMQKSEGKIVSSETMESVKEEMNQKLIDLADKYKESYEHDSGRLGYYDEFASVLSEGLKRKNLTSALREYGFKTDNIQPIQEYLSELRSQPTEYFEAKIQRGVGLNEFSVAVVPSDIKPDIKHILTKNGLKIYQYEKNNEQSRAKTVERATRENQNLLFSIAGATAYTGVDYLPVDDDTKKKLRAVLGIVAIGGLGLAMSKMSPNAIKTLAQLGEEAQGLVRDGKLKSNEIASWVRNQVAKQRELKTADREQINNNASKIQESINDPLVGTQPVERRIAEMDLPQVFDSPKNIERATQTFSTTARELVSDIASIAGGAVSNLPQSSRNLARKFVRATTEAAVNPEFKRVFDVVGDNERASNRRIFEIEDAIHTSREGLTPKEQSRVADLRYRENREEGIFTDSELSKMGYTEKEIRSINLLRDAQGRVIDIAKDLRLDEWNRYVRELEQKQVGLEGDKLKAVQKELSDAKNQVREIENYFQQLKDQGYLTLKRRGKYAVVAEDLSKPEGSPERFQYDQAPTMLQQKEIERTFAEQGFKNVKAYEIKKFYEKFREKLSPSELEQLIEDAGVDRYSPEAQKVMSEAKKRFATKSYELPRKYVPGYKRTMENLLKGLVNQAESFNNLYFKKIGREDAMTRLNQLDLEKRDPELYGFTRKYIDASFSTPEANTKGIHAAKKFTYLMQLGLDPMQFVFNGIFQPIMVTRPYFSRAEFNMKPFESDKYFGRAIPKAKEMVQGKAPKELQDIYNRAVKEGVATEVLSKELADIEAKEVGVLPTVSNKFAYFTKKGEQWTRSHTIAEAYLVGKEKMNLKGDELYRFIVDAVNNTQGKAGRGEMPELFRGGGEYRRAAYQFYSYVNLYVENIAQSIRNDIKAGKLSIPVTRKILGTLLVVGGANAFPGSGIAQLTYMKLTGSDPKEDLKKIVGAKGSDYLMYGITGSPSFSGRLGILNRIPKENTELNDLGNYIPAVRQLEDLYQGGKEISRGEYAKGAERFTPRGLRNVSKAIRMSQEGVTVGSGDRKETLQQPSELATPEYLKTVLGISSENVINYYNQKTLKGVQSDITTEQYEKQIDPKIDRELKAVGATSEPPRRKYGEVELSHDEHKKLTTEYVKQFNEIMNEIVGDTSWKELTEDEKKKYIRQAKQAALKYAKEEAVPDLQDRIQEEVDKDNPFVFQEEE